MHMGLARRSTRLFASIWAVLQFALPMAVLWGDAFQARESLGRDRTHVEETNSPNCRFAHADDCALCRFLSNSSGPVASGTSVVVPNTEPTSLQVEPRCIHGASTRRLPSSRAPPVA